MRRSTTSSRTKPSSTSASSTCRSARACTSPYNTDLLTLAAKRAVEAGIVVVAAAGNHGTERAGRRRSTARITAPGNAPWVMTVGASSHMGTAIARTTRSRPFSSRGPTAIDHAAKPDLVAPGRRDRFAERAGQHAVSTRRSPVPADRHSAPPYPAVSQLERHQQAAPVVAGTVALMLQANPALTPNAVKAILQYTAEAVRRLSVRSRRAPDFSTRGAPSSSRRLRTAPVDRDPVPDRLEPAADLGQSAHRGWRADVHGQRVGTGVVWGAPTASGAAARGVGCRCARGPSARPAAARGPRGARAVRIPRATRSSGARQLGECRLGHRRAAARIAEGTSGRTSDDDTVVWGNSDDGDTVVWGN